MGCALGHMAAKQQSWDLNPVAWLQLLLLRRQGRKWEQSLKWGWSWEEERGDPPAVESHAKSR